MLKCSPVGESSILKQTNGILMTVWYKKGKPVLRSCQRSLTPQSKLQPHNEIWYDNKALKCLKSAEYMQHCGEIKRHGIGIPIKITSTDWNEQWIVK